MPRLPSPQEYSNLFQSIATGICSVRQLTKGTALANDPRVQAILDAEEALFDAIYELQ